MIVSHVVESPSFSPMPKAECIRNKSHLASAKSKPLVASGNSESGKCDSIFELHLRGIEEEREKTRPTLTLQPTKKEKILERRKSFLRKLGVGHGVPSLSKNHARRMRRKAKEQLAGDTLAGLSHALASLEADHELAANSDTTAESKKPHRKTKLIGEGKSRPLSKSQRKRMLEVERFRHPLILQNPDFSANPFQTIQTHVKNTLVKHKSSTS